MRRSPDLRPAPIQSAARGGDLLSDGLNRDILRELLVRGPLSRGRLTAGLHARPTRIYERLRSLQDSGLLHAETRRRPPSYGITDSGESLIAVAEMIERWFAIRPLGPPESSVGWRAFAELADAWRSGLFEFVVRVAPSARELEHPPPGPAGRAERIAAMLDSGMVETYVDGQGVARHRLSAWSARAIGPLPALARWESMFRPPEAARIEREDALVSFLAGLPLLRVEGRSGLCLLSASGDVPQGSRPAGAWAMFEDGVLVEVGEGAPSSPADGWASGTFGAWLAAVLDDDPRGLRIGGRTQAGIDLAEVVVAELHHQLAAYRSEAED
jgi:DNA-binding HxlR family transcriptional regulator